MENNLTFNALSKNNEIRCNTSYHDINEWSPTDWACAVAGETGEMCNFVKKLRRLDSQFYKGIMETDLGSLEAEELIVNIGKELADIIIYADLLATRLGLKLGDEVTKKFNETSDKIHSDFKL